MMYNLLKDYKGYLLKSYSSETAATYYKRLCILLEGQNVIDVVKELDIQKVLCKLAEVKYKNHFSQSKNAFLQFCQFKGIKLSRDTLVQIKELEDVTKKNYRQLKSVDYPQVDRTIKHIR